MAGLCWMAVMLALLLSAGNSSATVDKNQLARLVDQILNTYRPSYMHEGQRKSPMFSLAISIPYNNERRMYDISQVPDTGEQVRNAIQSCNVYSGTRVVAATVLRWPDVLNQCPTQHVQWPDVLRRCRKEEMTWADVQRLCPGKIREGTADHAEFRTLQHFNTLLTNHNRNDLLLFYVFASPCAQRCASETSTRNILDLINPILGWNNYAFVFSKVFKPRTNDPIPEEDLQGALRILGTHQGALGAIGLENIFRCDGPPGRKQCTSCSTGGQVTRKCYVDEPQPGPRQQG